MMIKFDAVQIPYSCKPVGRSSVTRPVTSRGVLPYPVYIICYPTMSHYIMMSHHILLDHMLSHHVPLYHDIPPYPVRSYAIPTCSKYHLYVIV